MTPQERQLIDDLFDRLARLEGTPRDPEAMSAIMQGLRTAPNAVYALVQTTLVQDEALRRANARIEELEAAVGNEPREQQSSFLDSLRNAMFGTEQRRGSGSVPTVRPGEMARPDDRWNQGQAMGVPPGYGRGPDPGWQGGPGMGAYGGGAFGGGGSFLGTAAAAAAGVIGGSLLLNGIRNMMGPAHAGQSAFAADSDLSRQAGLKDIGGRRAGAYDDAQRDTDDRRDDSDRAADDSDDADYDDSDADYGDDTESV